MSAELIAALAFIASLAGFIALVQVLPGLARRYRRRFRAGVGDELGRAFVFVDTARLLLANLLAVLIVVGLVAWSSHSVPLALAVAILMAAIPRLVLRSIAGSRRRRFRHQVPELLNMISEGLRAGHGLSVVLGELAAQMPAPAGQELALMQRQERMGIRLDDSLAALERRMPLEETVLLVTALRLGSRTGGDMASTLESLADAVRRKLSLEGKVRALTAQGRLQAWVMGLLPVAMIGILALIEPGMFDTLLGTPAGWAVCGFVLLSEAVGMLMIRRIVAIEI